MLTKITFRASLTLSCALSITALGAREYENFDLPKSGQRVVVPESRVNYSNERISVKGKKVEMRESSVNAQTYIFVKEAFVSEKREEAIKLLRLELDAGMKANKDNILLRLGQLYAEKYMELSYRENEVFSDQLKKYEKARVTNRNAPVPKLENVRSQRYLKDAVAIFYNLEKEYPKHPKIDEVLFFIGFVELESGNATKGIGYMDRVIRQYPKSRKFDEAVVYLGDHYFEKAQFAAAAAKFRILLARSDTSLHDYATYKLAWCRLNTGESKKALADMRTLVERLEGTQDKAKFNLREQALKDMVIFYAETEQVEEAITFFTEKQGKEKASENLKLMADIFRSKARDAAAIKAYTRLLEDFGDTIEAPKLALGLYDSLSRVGQTDRAMKVLTDALEKYGSASGWEKSFPAEKLAEAKAEQEALATETTKVAMFHHQAGQKSSNKGHFDHALNLYATIMKNYPAHPERKKIAFYRGEILYSQAKWLDAANSYMEVAKIPPKDKLTDDSVYSALLALDRLTAKNDTLERFSKEEQKTVSLTPEEIPSNEKRFLEVADYYLKEYPTGSRVVDVRFRIAAIHYKYHHFDKAQAGFKDIALKHSTHRSASTAAHIVLDIFNIKKDYDSMNTHAVLFASTKNLGDAKFKSEMATISGEIGFKGIEKMEASNKWKEAGDSYYAFYKANPEGPLAEKALYNSLVSYEKGNDTVKQAEVSRLFLVKYPKSEYAQRLMLAQARSAEKLYDFDQAQKLYVDYYRKFPKDKDARKALYNAAVFAELLEMNKMAVDLYTDYLKGNVDKDEAKAIQFSLAKIYRRDKSYDKMASAYRRLYREAKSQDDKIAILGELARQYDRAGKMAEKKAVMDEIRVAFDESKNKPKGAGVQYAAESKFNRVGAQRDKYRSIALRFPEQDLLYLLKRKQNALTKLATAYDEVVDVGVPEWGVAALFEKSDAYDHFVKMYRKVEIPKRYKDQELVEAQASLKSIDAKLIAPLEAKSQEILKACVDRAAQFHVASEYATRCLERIDPTAQTLAQPSGLMPQPSYWSTRSLGEGLAKK